MRARGSRTQRCTSTRAMRRSQAGFTVIELMITAALIGVLASIALPYSKTVRQRSLRAEAMVNLKGIYTAEAAYHYEFDHYSDSFDELGFDIDGGTRIDASTIDGSAYRFQIGTYTYEGKAEGNFWATATADLEGSDGVMDVLLVENGLIIKE